MGIAAGEARCLVCRYFADAEDDSSGAQTRAPTPAPPCKQGGEIGYAVAASAFDRAAKLLRSFFSLGGITARQYGFR